MSLENLDPEIALRGHEELLPTCPCGCRSRRAAWYNIKKGHVKLPDYISDFKSEFAGSKCTLTEWRAIEKRIIVDNDFVRDPLHHWLTHLKLTAPWVTHDPNLVRMYREMLWCEENGVRRMSMMGHASSAKTNFMIIEAFQMLELWPKSTEVFVASPHLRSGSYTLWSEFQKYCEKRKEFTNLHIHQTSDYITTTERRADAGPGTIRLVPSDKSSVLQGKKQREHGDDEDSSSEEKSATRGRLIVCLDEVGRFSPTGTFVDALTNLLSQDTFRCRTSSNFDGFGGLIEYFYGPLSGDWDDLDRETSHRWKTVGNGICLRFQAKRSPNLTLNKDYYPYLLKHKEHDAILSFGPDSKQYLAQGDAFPEGVEQSRKIIVKKDFLDGQIYMHRELQKPERSAFLDAAFTHTGDAAIMYPFDYGYNLDKDQSMIHPGSAKQIPIPRKPTWTEEDVELARILRRGQSLRETVKVGAEMSGYEVCAIGSARYCRDNKIPLNNLSYDESLDGKFGSEMQYYLGDGPTAVSYGGKPDKRMAFPPAYKMTIENGKRVRARRNNDEMHRKKVSCMWFTGAAVIRAGYICGMNKSDKALDEATKRLKDEKSTSDGYGVGGYFDIETKSDYKNRNQQKSPDYADAFFGGIYMIVERRLQPQIDSAQASQKADLHQVNEVIQMNIKRDGFYEALAE